MSSHVLGHDIGLGESLAADIALIWLVPSMGLNMSHDLLSLCKCPALSFAFLPRTYVLAFACADMLLREVAGEIIEVFKPGIAALPMAAMLQLGSA